MKYEKYTVGDGFEYPFVWCWGDKLEGCPSTDKKKIYISIANGRFGSAFLSPDMGFFNISEKLGCSGEQALVVKSFIEIKHKDRIQEEIHTKQEKEKDATDNRPVKRDVEGTTDNDSPRQATERKPHLYTKRDSGS